MTSDANPSGGGRAQQTGSVDADRRGQRVGPYVVDECVAEGSVGRIFLARHAASDEPVALKILHGDVARDPVAVERFRREHETASSLVHERIVRVYDFGDTDDGSHYIAMQYVDGRELGAIIRDEGPIGYARLVRFVCQLAQGLQHAHRAGVIHRDLKPANILVADTEDGERMKIVDFGSVKLQMELGPKLTALGTTLGSPYYMSPEQAMGKVDLDLRSDVFAFAAIVHELSTGELAFGASSTSEILKRVTTDEPPPVSTLNPAYPWAFDEVIHKGLRKDKAARFGTAEAFAEEALRALGLPPDVARFAEATSEEIDEAQELPEAKPLTKARPAHEPSLPPLPIRKGGLGTRVAAVTIALAVAVAVAWWLSR
ncbi:MAG: serine/threonine-protein kinase [Myxococcota bacterium]